jgi:hypothetical protein
MIANQYGKVLLPHGSYFHTPSTIPMLLELKSNPRSNTSIAPAHAKHGISSSKRKLPKKTPVPIIGDRTCNIAIDIPSSCPSPKAQNLVMKAAPRIPKSPLSSKRRPKNKKSPRRAIICSSKKEPNLATSRSEFDSTSKVVTPNLRNSGHGVYHVLATLASSH